MFYSLLFPTERTLFRTHQDSLSKMPTTSRRRKPIHQCAHCSSPAHRQASSPPSSYCHVLREHSSLTWSMRIRRRSSLLSFIASFTSPGDLVRLLWVNSLVILDRFRIRFHPDFHPDFHLTFIRFSSTKKPHLEPARFPTHSAACPATRDQYWLPLRAATQCALPKLSHFTM